MYIVPPVIVIKRYHEGKVKGTYTVAHNDTGISELAIIWPKLKSLSKGSTFEAMVNDSGVDRPINLDDLIMQRKAPEKVKDVILGYRLSLVTGFYVFSSKPVGLALCPHTKEMVAVDNKYKLSAKKLLGISNTDTRDQAIETMKTRKEQVTASVVHKFLDNLGVEASQCVDEVYSKLLKFMDKHDV